VCYFAPAGTIVSKQYYKMNKIKFIIFIISAFFSTIFSLKAQTDTGNQQPCGYQSAYHFIHSMLTDEIPLSFKDAVFATEIAYYENDIDVEDLNSDIEILVGLANAISNPYLITYEKNDKDFMIKHAGIFSVMTDTIVIFPDSIRFFVHFPYIYDFDDPLGQEDWINMFVSKLLATGKGNCHSLPYLYKIVADELKIPCYLAFAPNHIYIKLFSEERGWYNTELTSRTFPIDAWIMASGYINTDAIRNGLYMDTLSAKQAVANCLVDLAHGYQHKFGVENPEFVIQCCTTALEYHPANVNAMLTKAEAQKHYIDWLRKKQNAKKIEDLFTDKAIAEMYSDMEQMYVRLHQLGYRRMPEKMYLEWLGLLENERNKYTNKRIESAVKK